MYFRSDINPGIISGIIPSLGALAVTSFFVLVGNQLQGQQKATFQFGTVAVSLAGCVAYLRSNSSVLSGLWAVFGLLPPNTRFILSLAIVCVVYLGGGFYAIVPGGEDVDAAADCETPATSDYVITFEVPDVLPEDDKVFFEQMFDRFTSEIIADLPTIYELPQEAVDWVAEMIPYTVAGGKMNRGLAVLSVQQTFAKHRGKTVSNKDRIQSAALGWCLEFLQGFFLVADDVMDGSITRRGAPCWYKKPEVNLIAINDSFILESCVFKILKRYLGAEPYYMQLVDIFLEVTRQTEFGQLLDLTSQPQGGVIDLDRFTLERYCSIVKYKTAFYSFYLPVACGMIVAGVKERRVYDTARKILCAMGEYFQVQDDYLDCYGSPEVIGKVGTDIQDNKCSWLIVQALQRVTGAQRRTLAKNYGRHDPKCIEAVKKIYANIGMTQIFEDYEEESYKSIKTMMNEVQELPSEVFEFLLKKIYKRSK